MYILIHIKATQWVERWTGVREIVDGRTSGVLTVKLYIFVCFVRMEGRLYYGYYTKEIHLCRLCLEIPLKEQH